MDANPGARWRLGEFSALKCTIIVLVALCACAGVLVSTAAHTKAFWLFQFSRQERKQSAIEGTLKTILARLDGPEQQPASSAPTTTATASTATTAAKTLTTTSATTAATATAMAAASSGAPNETEQQHAVEQTLSSKSIDAAPATAASAVQPQPKATPGKRVARRPRKQPPLPPGATPRNRTTRQASRAAPATSGSRSAAAGSVMDGVIEEVKVLQEQMQASAARLQSLQAEVEKRRSTLIPGSDEDTGLFASDNTTTTAGASAAAAATATTSSSAASKGSDGESEAGTAAAEQGKKKGWLWRRQRGKGSVGDAITSPAAYKLRQGQFKEAHLSRDDSWMHDETIQELLRIAEEERANLERLRQQAEGKVNQLRAAQSVNPQVLSFRDKLAFFGTYNAQLTPEQSPQPQHHAATNGLAGAQDSQQRGPLQQQLLSQQVGVQSPPQQQQQQQQQIRHRNVDGSSDIKYEQSSC